MLISLRGSGRVSSILSRMTSRAAFGPMQGLANDVVVDAFDLDVELDRGDAVAGAAYLEVHVAEVIFLAEDVGQEDDRSPSFTRPTEMPATGLVMGTPASMRARHPPQLLAIELEPLDSRMSLMIRTVYGN